MSSFKRNERAQFGQKLRLAMACIESPSEPIKGKAIPDNEASVRQRLKSLSQEMTSQHADLLALLVKFDDLQGWKISGARHWAAWMNVEIGISLQLSWGTYASVANCKYYQRSTGSASLTKMEMIFWTGETQGSMMRKME